MDGSRLPVFISSCFRLHVFFFIYPPSWSLLLVATHHPLFPSLESVYVTSEEWSGGVEEWSRMSSHQTLLDRFLVFAPRSLPSLLFFPNSDFPSTPDFLRSLLFFPTRISLSLLILFPPFFFFSQLGFPFPSCRHVRSAIRFQRQSYRCSVGSRKKAAAKRKCRWMTEDVLWRWR